MKKLAQLVLATGLLTTACAASAQGLAAAQARAFPRHLSSRRDQHRSLSALHKRLDCQRARPRHIGSKPTFRQTLKERHALDL